jgi:hypothetical protein
LIFTFPGGYGAAARETGARFTAVRVVGSISPAEVNGASFIFVDIGSSIYPVQNAGTFGLFAALAADAVKFTPAMSAPLTVSAALVGEKV